MFFKNKTFHTFLFAQTQTFKTIRRLHITTHIFRYTYVFRTLFVVTIRSKGRIPFRIRHVINKIQVEIVEDGSLVTSLDLWITAKTYN